MSTWFWCHHVDRAINLLITNILCTSPLRKSEEIHCRWLWIAMQPVAYCLYLLCRMSVPYLQNVGVLSVLYPQSDLEILQNVSCIERNMCAMPQDANHMMGTCWNSKFGLNSFNSTYFLIQYMHGKHVSTSKWTLQKTCSNFDPTSLELQSNFAYT